MTNKNRKSVEFFYCGRYRHTTLNCKTRSKDLLSGKIKESINLATIEDLSDVIFEESSDNDNEFPFEPPLKLF